MTIASMKMYYRNKTGLFFTLFFPIVLIFVFGFLSNSDGKGSIKISLTDKAQTQLSKSYVSAIKKIDAFKITEESNENVARTQLGKAKIDLQVVIPRGFGNLPIPAPSKTPMPLPNARPGVPVSASSVPPVQPETDIMTYYNQGKPGNGQTAGLILGQVAQQFNNQIVKAPTVIGLKATGVKTNNLGYIDFVLPGILAMTVMQVGIFSVAFSFISYKTSGALRRLQAAPINATNFLIAQSVTRYIITMLQLVLLTVLGIALFHLHLLGSIFDLFIVFTLGTIVFLAMGFAVAGRAKDENQVAPLAQLLQLPQMFLSGIFFPRDSFPHWLKALTDYFPLTFLSDAVRTIFNEGASLWSLRVEVLGLVVWAIIMYFIADRVFKWE